MRDVFFTVLIIWVVWRIVSSFQRASRRSKQAQYSYEAEQRRQEGEVTIDKVPQEKGRNRGGDKGEYVDYEEIKE